MTWNVTVLPALLWSLHSLAHETPDTCMCKTHPAWGRLVLATCVVFTWDIYPSNASIRMVVNFLKESSQLFIILHAECVPVREYMKCHSHPKTFVHSG